MKFYAKTYLMAKISWNGEFFRMTNACILSRRNGKTFSSHICRGVNMRRIIGNAVKMKLSLEMFRLLLEITEMASTSTGIRFTMKCITLLLNTSQSIDAVEKIWIVIQLDLFINKWSHISILRWLIREKVVSFKIRFV